MRTLLHKIVSKSLLISSVGFLLGVFMVPMYAEAYYKTETHACPSGGTVSVSGETEMTLSGSIFWADQPLYFVDVSSSFTMTFTPGYYEIPACNGMFLTFTIYPDPVWADASTQSSIICRPEGYGTCYNSSITAYQGGTVNIIGFGTPSFTNLITNYEWSEGGCPGVVLGSGQQVTLSNPTAGTRNISFRVQDNKGTWSSCVTWVYYVTEPAPIVATLNLNGTPPGAGSFVPAETGVTVSMSHTYPDGQEIDKEEIYNGMFCGGEKIATGHGATYTFTTPTGFDMHLFSGRVHSSATGKWSNCANIYFFSNVQNIAGDCLSPWLTTVTSGSSVTAYQSSSVISPTTCVSEARTCSSGTLSGSYLYQSCAVAPPGSATLPWGGTIANGSSVTAYQDTSVISPATCTPETRINTSGTLSGTYQNQTCVVINPNAPAGNSCLLPPSFGGGTISSGSTIGAYLSTSVTSPATCTSETRTCTNGVLSGSYTNPSCSVLPVGSCTLPWGGTIAGGSSTTAYQSSSVTPPSTCTSETRTCTSGTLSGTYTNSTCAVGIPPIAIIDIPTADMSVAQSTPVSFSGSGTSGAASVTVATSTFATVGAYPIAWPYMKALAFDTVGNLYTANTTANTVSKITPAGVVTTFATVGSYPIALAFDTAGDLYTANINSSNISKITPAGVVTTFATTPGDYPTALAFDTAGNLYTASANGLLNVYKITPAGVVTTFASFGVNITALAFDTAGNLYVDTFNTVYKITPAGVTTTFASVGSYSSALAFDTAGNLYTLDSNAYLISKITPAGAVTTFATIPNFDSPTAFVFDALGNLDVLGSQKTYQITPVGAISVLATVSGTGLVLDTVGNLYTLDRSTGKVIKISITTPSTIIVAYEWRESNCTTGILLSSLSTFNLSTPTAGVRTIYLRVQDSLGIWSTNCPSRTITVTAPACPAGQTYDPGTSSCVCTNGATNPSACNTCPVGQTYIMGTNSCVNNCTNGATNPSACNTCPVGQTYIVGTNSCVNNCTNGATNPPTCTTTGGSCLNGATNPPTCDTCASGYTMYAGTCYANCTNGAINPPNCNACSIGKTYYSG